MVFDTQAGIVNPTPAVSTNIDANPSSNKVYNLVNVQLDLTLLVIAAAIDPAATKMVFSTFNFFLKKNY